MPGSLGAPATSAGAVRPSLANALPFFVSLVIFPLGLNAAIQGGWWIAAPFLFMMIPDFFDAMFGLEERNMDPRKTLEGELFWYKLSLWLWAVLWPATLVFTLWQILVAGHLATWESVLMALVLSSVAQASFIIGHELIHRRSPGERRIGEFILASVSYPHYASEHVYVHHALACTPGDPGSAPLGCSLWRYLPREIKSNLLGAWRFERDRLARRHLPVWHYTNPFWRYVIETSAWYALAYWLGGAWAVLIYAVLCSGVIFSMKIINYVQHYGLRRIRLPNGRYERVQPWHSWSAAYRLSNWFFYNMQRHPDHHTAPNRRYPLLQHCGANEAPQLPGSYVEMAGLALFPGRWFKKMDPLVDQWRQRFYPQITDWSAYDSAATAARPDAFEAITEIFVASPRLTNWINRAPELLDNLTDKEFTDPDLADGVGPDPAFEAIARSGLARVYWTYEFGIAEMKEQIEDNPAQDARETVDAVRNWSNDKTFQIAVHMIRGNLSPGEAATALSNVAEASITAVLSAVEEDFAGRRAEGGLAAVFLGNLASRESALGLELDVMFVYEGGPEEHYQTLCRGFDKALRELSGDSLLFAPVPRDRDHECARKLADFLKQYLTTESAEELPELTRARCAFTSGDSRIGKQFEDARQEILAHDAARDKPD